MKKLAIALILCLSAANGFSQCKTDRVSARKEMHMASAVVVGTVTAAQPVPEAWDFLDGVNYTVRVDSKIHGKARPNTEVTVFSENSPRFFPMYVGQQYVLYLQPQYGRNRGGQLWQFAPDHRKRICIDQAAETDCQQRFLSLLYCCSALKRGIAPAVPLPFSRRLLQ